MPISGTSSACLARTPTTEGREVDVFSLANRFADTLLDEDEVEDED